MLIFIHNNTLNFSHDKFECASLLELVAGNIVLIIYTITGDAS